METLVTIDLDWLNGDNNPEIELENLLNYIPRNIPAVMTIEHHESLPHIMRWVKEDQIKKPFNIVIVDEHHDCYDNRFGSAPESSPTNCGNWVFHIPTHWYNKLTWMQNGESGIQDWAAAQRWLSGHAIEVEATKENVLEVEIVAATFCLSPDYMWEDVLECAPILIDAIRRHFELLHIPLRNHKYDANLIAGWEISPSLLGEAEWTYACEYSPMSTGTTPSFLV